MTARMRLTGIAVTAGLVGGVSSGLANVLAADRDSKPITEIRVERSIVTSIITNREKMVVRSDGKMEFEVNGGGLLTRRTGSIDQVQFKRLAELVDRGGFSEMKERYPSSRTHDWWLTITVKRGDSEKRVTHGHTEGPVELWGIEQAVFGFRVTGFWAD